MFKWNDVNCRGLSPLSLILIPNAYSVKVTRSHAANMSARIDVLQKDMARPKSVGLDAITMDGDMVTPYSGKIGVTRPCGSLKGGRPLGSILSCTRKKASLAQPDPLISDTQIRLMKSEL